MKDFSSLQPVNPTVFQVAWESTLKCNLDCSYCGDGHDNSTSHPSLESSIQTIDFILEYLDLYMSIKPTDQRVSNINIQGGESIFHPNILEILDYLKSKKSNYKDWKLTVSLITNAVVGKKTWMKIVDMVDNFTISYHPEMLDKQRLMFKSNVSYLKSKKNSFHVAVLMHPKYWDNCLEIIEWCKQNQITALPRQIDHHWSDLRFNYSNEQAEFLTGKSRAKPFEKIIKIFKNGIDLSSQGRACCGGHCLEKNTGVKTNFVEGNNFKGWSCSVNEFFLYVRQITGEVFTNKDCRMNLESKVGPIGNLSNTTEILNNLKSMLIDNTLPTIICKKSSCWCGLCAPKAIDQITYNQLMLRYRK
jgi:sulfatase maturation enzyme AslB (radical SAM superfamily)